eukprot:8219756-Pyramimonas_sp.AAC.1
MEESGSRGSGGAGSGADEIKQSFETMQWMMVEDRKERAQQMKALIEVVKCLGAIHPVAAPEARSTLGLARPPRTPLDRIRRLQLQACRQQQRPGHLLRRPLSLSQTVARGRIARLTRRER